MRRLAAMLLAVALLAPAGAQGAEPKASFTNIEKEVMCVSCNVVLNIAESPQADRQRALIRDLIDDGLTEGQIKDRLVEQYGPNVLALPDDGGFGLAAYLVPIAVAVFGLGLVAVLLPRWRRRGVAAAPAAPAAGPDLSAADARRLDEDLARYES